jgi:hypothetical protein
MKRLVLFFAVIFFALTGHASAVYCPVGGAIYHRSGEESAAIARCTEYIKQARASGQKIPDERSWRAAKPWTAIANSQPYPLSWSSSGKGDTQKEAAAKPTPTTRTAVAAPSEELRKPPQAKPVSQQPTPKVAATADTGRTQPASTATRPATGSEASNVMEPVASPTAVRAQEAPPPRAQEGNPGLTTKAATIAAALETSATTGPIVQKERRVALVIGNGKYAAQGLLDNPRNDAEATSAAFRELGFQSVTTLHDLGRDKIIEALQNFANEADGSDWAVVYYAGHGIEAAGINYLVPVDAKLKTDRDIPFEAVALDHVLNSVESARKLRLVILDACRDNPFVPHMRKTLASRAIGRGLAPIETDKSMLVFFAAKHGQVSLDQVDGENSPFTTSLVRWMKVPDLEINKLFRHVRDDVLKVTNRSQEPYQYGSLSSEDFYFRRSSIATSPE